MLFTALAGLIGLLVQLAIFVGVLALTSRARGVALAAVYGGTAAVYGYALVVSFTSLLGLPWQVTNVLGALALSIAALVPSVREELVSGLLEALGAIRRSWGPVVIISVVVLAHASVAVIKPEFSVDGQLYHGTVLAELLQNGSLWGWHATNEFVYYTDLTMAGGVNLATFTGEARFDDALQIPHLVVLILLVQWALRTRFASTFTRVSLAVLIASAPVIWLQPRVMYVDLAYGTAVAAVVLLLALRRTLRIPDLVVLGILVGAVFATKPTGILTGVLLGVAVIVVAVVRRRSTPTRATIGALAAGLLPALLLATAFYVRNLVQFGNPVFPVALKVGPLTLPGIIDFGVFSAAEEGSGGILDPARILSYLGSLGYGMVHGVTKLDYDPRTGGFGYVPLVVLVIAVALVVIQFVARRRGSGAASRTWPSQVAIVAVALPIVAVQPMAYDARYLIGPTVALLVAVLLTSVSRLPRPIELVAGVLALSFAFVQVLWTERTLLGGAGSALELRTLGPEWQAPAPGNPWGESTRTDWLPADECVTIAVQTSGGLTASGMSEGSYLATFPYALYGDELCNRVLPITLRDRDADDPLNRSALLAADYLVIYRDDADEWIDALGDAGDCLREVDRIPADTVYTEPVAVLEDACAVLQR